MISITCITTIVLLFLTVHTGILESKHVYTDDVVAVTTGRFVKVDPVSGTNRSLHKDDIDKLGKGDNHLLRFHFDDDELFPLDMKVSQGSVWSRDSVVEVQKESHTENVPHELDERCFLRGRLNDLEGMVIIIRCGRVRGNIQTPDHHYNIEEHDTGEGADNPTHTTFKVTKKKHEPEVVDRDYERDAIEIVTTKTMDEIADSSNNTMVRRKRDIVTVTIELVAYLDKNYVDYLWYEKDFTTPQVIDFIINKWNMVQNALSDVTQVGARIRIALKRIVLWHPNPTGYPADNVGVNVRLHWFCTNTPETNHFDQKVLYTKGTGGHQMGSALLSGTCQPDRKCYLVKSRTERATTEIHEMGHSLGLLHDPDIGGCDPEGGFMGWGMNYNFLSCYRRVLMKKFRESSFGCLFNRNVHSRNLLETNTN